MKTTDDFLEGCVDIRDKTIKDIAAEQGLELKEGESVELGLMPMQDMCAYEVIQRMEEKGCVLPRKVLTAEEVFKTWPTS